MLPVTIHPGKREFFLAPAEETGPPGPAQSSKAARRPVCARPKPCAVVRGGCNKGSGNKRGRMAHRRAHTGIGKKNCVCSWKGCGRTFRQAGDLKKHWRVHSGEKPFVCPYEGCEYASTQSNNLKQHQRLHSGEKPFVCSDKNCGRAFAARAHLTRHLLLHSGKKPFVCPHEGCEHACRAASALKLHLRVHTGEQLFVCPHEGCGCAFAARARLTQHLRRHSGESPFVFWYTGCTTLSVPSGSGPHLLCRDSAGRCWSLEGGETGLPVVQESRFSFGAGPLSGVAVEAGPAVELHGQSPEAGSGSFRSTTTATSGEHQLRARSASPDAQDQLASSLPPSPLLQGLACAGLEPWPLQDFDVADWLTGDVDDSCGWPSGADTADMDTTPPALTDDDQAFWRALLVPADTHSARSES